jgi:hypothetical protein
VVDQVEEPQGELELRSAPVHRAPDLLLDLPQVARNRRLVDPEGRRG